MTERTEFDPIDIYCDDPRHAQRKIADLGTLLVLGSGKAARWAYIGTRHKRKEGKFPGLGDSGEQSLSFACPLCPRRPALIDGLEFQTFLDGLAKLSQTRVNVSVLDAYAAKLAGR